MEKWIINNKWWIFTGITVCYLISAGGLVFVAIHSENAKPDEIAKIIFLGIGGLGVFLPLFLSVANAMESRAFEKIENTFELLTKWDDSSLFEARKYTRKIKQSKSSISDDDLIKEITSDELLSQSIILVANYFLISKITQPSILDASKLG
jgi:hypothetical protein